MNVLNSLQESSQLPANVEFANNASSRRDLRETRSRSRDIRERLRGMDDSRNRGQRRSDRDDSRERGRWRDRDDSRERGRLRNMDEDSRDVVYDDEYPLEIEEHR